MTRFIKADRQKTINFLNIYYNANFVKLFNFEKLLFDQNSKTAVVIFGGTGDWHGITSEIMDFLVSLGGADYKQYIILVEKRGFCLDIFSGALDIFVKEKNKLIRNKDGDYQFHHERKDNKICLKEDTNLELNIIGTV